MAGERLGQSADFRSDHHGSVFGEAEAFEGCAEGVGGEGQEEGQETRRTSKEGGAEKYVFRNWQGFGKIKIPIFT